MILLSGEKRKVPQKYQGLNDWADKQLNESEEKKKEYLEQKEGSKAAFYNGRSSFALSLLQKLSNN